MLLSPLRFDTGLAGKEGKTGGEQKRGKRPTRKNANRKEKEQKGTKKEKRYENITCVFGFVGLGCMAGCGTVVLADRWHPSGALHRGNRFFGTRSRSGRNHSLDLYPGVLGGGIRSALQTRGLPHQGAFGTHRDPGNPSADRCGRAPGGHLRAGCGGVLA